MGALTVDIDMKEGKIIKELEGALGPKFSLPKSFPNLPKTE